LNMVLDAAKGMMYLHSSEPPVIHRDLKSPNLLVDKHWRIKVPPAPRCLHYAASCCYACCNLQRDDSELQMELDPMICM